MGLNPRHLKEFQAKRFYSSLILENIPQLVIQIYFLTLLGAFDEATFVALLSSSISVILSVVDIWSAKQIVTIIDDAKSTTINHIEFMIKSNDEIEHQKQILLTKPRALAKAIAKTLIVDVRTIEIYLLMASQQGIKVGFTIYSIESDLYKILDDMIEEQTKLQLLITNYWKLKQFPEIGNFHRGQRTNFEDGDDTKTTTTANTLHPEGRNLGKTMLPEHIPLNRMNSSKWDKVLKQDPELMSHIDEMDEAELTFDIVDVQNLRFKSSQWKSLTGKMEHYTALQSRSPTPCTPKRTNIALFPIVIDENQHWSVYSKKIEQLLLQRELLQNEHNQAIDDEMKEWNETLSATNMKQHRVTQVERADSTISILEEKDDKSRFNIKDLQHKLSKHQHINSGSNNSDFVD